MQNSEPAEKKFEVDSYVESIIQLDGQIEQLLKEDKQKYFVTMVVQRLLNFGLKLDDNDKWLIIFGMTKQFNHVKNSCNITVIPEELYEILIDRICGEFLFNKQKSNQLSTDNFNFDTAVKQIQLGDTNISFSTGEGSETDDVKINSLINYLINYGEGDLICYRKLKW